MNPKTKLSLVKYGVWATSVLVPLAVGFLESWQAAGASGPVVALLLRQFDKTVIEPWEADLVTTGMADTDTSNGTGDPVNEPGAP